MKVLIVNKFLYPKGGAEVITLATGRILGAHGHEVYFWGMDHPANPEYSYQDLFVTQVEYDDLDSIRFKVFSALNIFYSFDARKKMAALLRKIKPDIVHLNNFAHQISPSILNVIKRHNIPVIMTMHDYKMVCPSYSMLSKSLPCEKCKNGRYYNCGINRCTKGSFLKSLVNVFEMYLHHKILNIYKDIDIYISPSEFLKNKVSEMGFKGEVAWLPNCVDTENFRPSFKWQDKVILYVGRLSHEKGISTLIDAIKGIDIPLRIIGDGPLRESLQRKVKDEKISNVEFLGYQFGSMLHDEIRKAMFLVVPSECYENNPLAIIESFALGKPVIGARIGGIPELVKDWETGLLFTSGDVVDLQAKMMIMLKNRNQILEMGRHARLYVENKLNSEIYYQNLMTIYQRAARNVEGNNRPNKHI